MAWTTLRDLSDGTVICLLPKKGRSDAGSAVWEIALSRGRCNTGVGAEYWRVS